MRGLMMDYELSIPAMVRRSETLFPRKRVVSRVADRSIVRRTYGEILDRARRLSVTLSDLGVRPGDRVATLAWAGHQHLEAYLGIPCMGAVLHTLNLRLHHDDLTYIVNDARDRVLIVDESLLPLLERFRSKVAIEHVLVIPGTPDAVPQLPGKDFFSYEEAIAAADPVRFVPPRIEEEDAAAMCYTSGTTGRPKGVLYSHRAILLHSLGQGLRDTLGICESDVLLPVVPMFHVNAWGMPFTGTFFGCDQVLPGPCLDAMSVAELLSAERVTVTAGVPTVWLGLLQELDANPGKYDLSRLRAIAVGGAAAPPALISGFQERHNLAVVHAWGMTETTPLGTLCHLPESLEGAPVEEQYRYRARQGTPMPLVEIRAMSAQGEVPWDGQTMGELEVRGPWVAAQYYNVQGPDDRFSADGWFRTGDIVTISPSGCIELTDRSKDLVKSGGEWISSVALESALMCHPSVAEAAVIAVPHPKWDERPLAVVARKPGQSVTAEELLAYLEPKFAKWWLPDAFEFTTEIPRTSVGKFKKSALREQFKDRYQTAGDKWNYARGARSSD